MPGTNFEKQVLSVICRSTKGCIWKHNQRTQWKNPAASPCKNSHHAFVGVPWKLLVHHGLVHFHVSIPNWFQIKYIQPFYHLPTLSFLSWPLWAGNAFFPCILLSVEVSMVR